MEAPRHSQENDGFARGGLAAVRNLSSSSHFLLFDIEPGCEPPALRSSNTTLRSMFSVIAASNAALSYSSRRQRTSISAYT